MKHTNKLWALLIALVALVALCAFAASAEVLTGECGANGNNVTWSYDTETCTLTVSGEGAMMEWDVEHGERAPWYSYSNSIKTFVAEDGVTTIGQGAMYYCRSLDSVTLPESITKIGAGAFLLCDTLRAITIPKNVTYAYMAFASSGISNVSFEEGVTTIPSGMFIFMEELASITIPNSVETIGAGAFTGCPNLTTVRVGTGVRSIGYAAFEGHEDLWVFNTENSSLTQIVTCMSESEWANVAMNVVDPDDEHAVEMAGYFPDMPIMPDTAEVIFNAHSPGASHEETTEPSCTAYGHTDQVVSCTLCGRVSSRLELSTTPALGHNVESVNWLWANDGSMANATGVCTRCEQSLTEAATVTRETQADESILCTAVATFGEREFTGTKTVQTGAPQPSAEDPHPGQDHQVASVTWAWTSDGTGATAIGICARCNQPVSAVATVRAETNGDGGKTCYATATLGGQTFTDTKTFTDGSIAPKPKTGARCSMCDMNDEYKGIPVVGWIVSLVHYFIHLASRIVRATR